MTSGKQPNRVTIEKWARDCLDVRVLMLLERQFEIRTQGAAWIVPTSIYARCGSPSPKTNSTDFVSLAVSVFSASPVPLRPIERSKEGNLIPAAASLVFSRLIRADEQPIR
jgi:hypothetical protein